MIYLMLICYITVFIISIIFTVKIFLGKRILIQKAELGATFFTVNNPGFYSIWISRKLFLRIALAKRKVDIIDTKENKMKAIKSYVSPKVNGFSNGSIQLKYYYLKKGKYQLTISEEQESSIGFSNRLSIFKNEIDGSTDFTYILKKSTPEFLFPFLVLGIVAPLLEIIEIVQTLLINN